MAYNLVIAMLCLLMSWSVRAQEDILPSSLSQRIDFWPQETQVSLNPQAFIKAKKIQISLHNHSMLRRFLVLSVDGAHKKFVTLEPQKEQYVELSFDSGTESVALVPLHPSAAQIELLRASLVKTLENQ